MATNILQEIFARRKRDVELQKKTIAPQVMEAKAKLVARPRDFLQAITSRDFAVIAEHKLASPSAGAISDHSVADIASQYEKAGATAMSVLTEPHYFSGGGNNLAIAKKACALPILRKDFLFDSYQIDETIVFGGDAVLLIAAMLPEALLAKLIVRAFQRGLGVLVEVVSVAEATVAMACGANCLGVNHRDLRDFSIDLSRSEPIRQVVPADIPLLAESGIRTRRDVQAMRQRGMSGMLIGSSLMQTKHPGRALRSLLAAEVPSGRDVTGSPHDKKEIL